MHEDDHTTYKDSSSFFGQIGPIYMFNEAITAEQVKGIYYLGPSYMYSFLDNTVALSTDHSLPSGMLDSKDGLASRIMFGLNAQVFFLVSNCNLRVFGCGISVVLNVSKI